MRFIPAVDSANGGSLRQRNTVAFVSPGKRQEFIVRRILLREPRRTYARTQEQQGESQSLAHERTIAALGYIQWRYQRGAGAALDRREYRGLMPHTRLILTQKGGAFELSVKRWVNFDGEVEYPAADSLQSGNWGWIRHGFGQATRFAVKLT
jgi:hypothetical protein